MANDNAVERTPEGRESYRLRGEHRTTLSTSRGVVTLVRREYLGDRDQTKTELEIEKAFDTSDTNYTEKDGALFLREKEILKHLAGGVQAVPFVPRFLGEKEDGTKHIFTVEYKKGHIMSDLYPALDDALMRLQEGLIPHELSREVYDAMDQNKRDQLINQGRLVPTAKGPGFKSSLVELFRDKGKLQFDPAVRAKDMLDAFDLSVAFSRMATQLLSVDNPLVAYGREDYLADFRKALKYLTTYTPSLSNKEIEKATQFFGDTILPIIISVPKVVIHGDFTPFNILIDLDQKSPDKRYSLLDLGHVHVANPLIDTANYVQFCKLFCGMDEVIAGRIWEHAMGFYDIKAHETRPAVKFFRDVEVVGALAKRLSLLKGRFSDYELQAIKFRMNAYKEEVRKTASHLSEIVAGEKVKAKELSGMIGGVLS